LESLAKGFWIFNLQGNEYKVDDSKGAMGSASDITGFKPASSNGNVFISSINHALGEPKATDNYAHSNDGNDVPTRVNTASKSVREAGQ
jgi:hypothetical protein